MSISFSNEDHFYIELLSNVNDFSYFNKIGNFRTKVAYPLNFGDDKWEVGLSEIIYTKSWFNLNNDQVVSVIFSDGVFVESNPHLLRGFYENVEALVSDINEHMFAIVLQFNNGKMNFISPKLVFKKNLNKIFISAGSITDVTSQKKECFPFLGNELQQMLGLQLQYQKEYESFTQTFTITQFRFTSIKAIKDSLKGKNLVDLSRGIHSLFVYCDIVKPSLAGDTFAQLMRFVPVQKNIPFAETISKTFDDIHYYSVNSHNIQSVEIDIKDDAGETIKFQTGRVYLKLHFRRK